MQEMVPQNCLPGEVGD